ncbi:MAG: hypothetical protein JW864_10680 [Spirochaetes bacterium]|nr:hypothetical protein [Spirochaetota bacterium]
MKNKYLISFFLLTLLISFSTLYGCKGESGENAASNCATTCHAENTEIGNQLLAASAGYENSGHYNGPRTLVPSDVTTYHLYIFHGSNANYANGGGCQQCHTHQGFMEYLEEGSADDLSVVPAASQVSCYTCHSPHEEGNFELTTISPVTLVDGTTVYDGGDGNLCANCHQSTSTVTSYLTVSSWPAEKASYQGMHHGPQADFIMGVNHWVYGSNTSYGESDHSGDTIADTCSTCHHYMADDRLSGSLQLGGHGFYLKADVHGSNKDLTVTCTATGCHDSDFTGYNPTFLTGDGHTALDYDGDTTAENILQEIKGMRDTLISYFGNGAANFGGDGNGPIVDITDGTDMTSGEWGLNWEFATATMTEAQAQSFWNFRYFMEDKSMGIHNPTFAAQILWDALENLGLTNGATRPQ